MVYVSPLRFLESGECSALAVGCEGEDNNYLLHCGTVLQICGEDQFMTCFCK
jgi:hypothetical protein